MEKQISSIGWLPFLYQISILLKRNFVLVTLIVFCSTSERIEEIKHIEKRRREQDDSEERKYSAEEKEVEEKRKSVRERTQDIEKRLSQTSMEEQLQRRDSQLLQGVSEGLEKLNVTQQREAEGMFLFYFTSFASYHIALEIVNTLC